MYRKHFAKEIEGSPREQIEEILLHLLIGVKMQKLDVASALMELEDVAPGYLLEMTVRRVTEIDLKNMAEWESETPGAGGPTNDHANR